MKIRMVKDVEGLKAELQKYPFREPSILDEREIDIYQPRTNQRITTFITLYVKTEHLAVHGGRATLIAYRSDR